MDAARIREGDQLACLFIQNYWDTFTGTGSTWNFYNFPPHYTLRDRWATREQWIAAAKQCIEDKTKVLFGLEILLAEGYTEYLELATEIVQEWQDEYHGHDPEYYYDILKYLPHDNPVRRKYLSRDPAELDQDPLRALISVDDAAACTHVAGKIAEAYAPRTDDNAREIALRWIKLLGRRCAKYVDPAVMESAKRFCLAFLERDREIAPHREQIVTELWANPDDNRRSLWICDDIAYLAWSVGWFDILTSLRYQPWYWDNLFTYWWSDGSNENLMVWSQYVVSDMLRERALHVMLTHQYSRTDGAIAWVRMSHAVWPPRE